MRVTVCVACLCLLTLPSESVSLRDYPHISMRRLSTLCPLSSPVCTPFRWVLLLHLKSRHLLQPYLEELFPALLKTLSDPAEEVVRLDLEVMAKVTKNEEYFTLLMSSLISLFSTDRQLLENRGSLIIRQLRCVAYVRVMCVPLSVCTTECVYERERERELQVCVNVCTRERESYESVRECVCVNVLCM
jgi:hypothetical protein